MTDNESPFEWHSIRDQLPQLNTSVLVYVDNRVGDGVIDDTHYLAIDRLALCDGDENPKFVSERSYNVNVTHWMAIQPPKDSTEDKK